MKSSSKEVSLPESVARKLDVWGLPYGICKILLRLTLTEEAGGGSIEGDLRFLYKFARENHRCDVLSIDYGYKRGEDRIYRPLECQIQDIKEIAIKYVEMGPLFTDNALFTKDSTLQSKVGFTPIYSR